MTGKSHGVNGSEFRARFPALALWRRRVCAGVEGQRADAPGTWRLDGLWAAATWEQAAWEAEQAGELERCERHREQARREMAAALTRQGRVA